MSSSSLWLIILLAGAGTFLIRLSFIWLIEYVDRLAAVRRALRYVPVAVLPAIVAPALLMQNGAPAVSWNNARLAAGLMAILVARLTKSMLLTIAAGMATLWLLQALG